jgi:hypothetical protein
MNIGDGFVLRQGQVGYFGEGVAYGPREDLVGEKRGERLQLTLRFGGASGYGFMSIEQRRQAILELKNIGSFSGPHFRRNDGHVEWGRNAVWRHVFGKQLRYPRPCYKDPVIVDPCSFNWLPVGGAKDVEHKFMGSFSERGVWIEFFRLQLGVKWTSKDERARRLFVVLSGDGLAAGETVKRLSALQVEPGETLDLTATADITLFLIGLPSIERPLKESEEYDLEELPENTIETAA